MGVEGEILFFIFYFSGLHRNPRWVAEIYIDFCKPHVFGE